MAKRKRTVDSSAAAPRKSRVAAAVAVHALLALVLAGSFQAFAPPAAASDEPALEASSRETASEQTAPVDSLLARGDRALEDGDADVAEKLFSEVLSRESREHRALCGIAIVGLIEDDPDKAIKYARKAVKADKKNSRYHFMLANGYGMKAQRGGLRAMYYGGKFKQECELAVEYDVENIDAHFALLHFSVQAPSFMGGGIEKARERAETIAAIDGYHGHIANAVIAKQEDDLAAAESSYLAAASVDSMNADGWYELGLFYNGTGRPLDAVRVFERVCGLTPDDLPAIYQLAKAHLLAGDDLAAAEEGFRTYILADSRRPNQPDVASAHWRLALVYEGQGRYAEAKAELDEAIRLNPEHEMAIESRERLEAEHP